MAIETTHGTWSEAVRVLTPDFGTIKNLFKMASNGEVFYMKKFHVVDTNIFEVWAIAI